MCQRPRTQAARTSGPASRSLVISYTTSTGFFPFLVTVRRSCATWPMRAVHLRLLADLSRWLGERGETSAGLGTPLLAEFIAVRRAAGHRTGLSMLALRPLTEYPRETGAVPPEKPARPSGAAEERSPSTRHTCTPSAGLRRRPSSTRPSWSGRSWPGESGTVASRPGIVRRSSGRRRRYRARARPARRGTVAPT
jgi:hypothetical protein